MPNAIMFVSESLELYRELCKALQDVAPLIPTLKLMTYELDLSIVNKGAAVGRCDCAASNCCSYEGLTEYLAGMTTGVFAAGAGGTGRPVHSTSEWF